MANAVGAGGKVIAYECNPEVLEVLRDNLSLNYVTDRVEVANYHGLRTRKAGSQRHVVVHIVVSRERTVEEGHRIAEDMEDQIRKSLRNATVTIHVEPCTPDCAECPAQCEAARERAGRTP